MAKSEGKGKFGNVTEMMNDETKRKSGEVADDEKKEEKAVEVRDRRAVDGQRSSYCLRKSRKKLPTILDRLMTTTEAG